MFWDLHVHHQGENININSHLNFILPPVCLRIVGISSQYDLHLMNMYKENLKKLYV